MHAYSGDDRLKMLSAIATVAVVIAICINFVWSQLDLGLDWLISAPSVAGAFVGLYQLVDRRAWRWSWLHRVGLIDTPVVDGTYAGTLNSTWPGDPIPVSIRVEQRWSQISIRFEVTSPATSTSSSVTAALHRAGHDDATITYTYKNLIRPATADSDMRDHDGTADLTISPDGSMRGRYFNARGRQGDISAQKLDD